MKNIICLGDSTTYGYMVNRKNIWTSILNDKFKEDNKDIIFINKGINGDMISGMFARFDIDCIKENPNMTTEDFSYYLQRVKGAFFSLGVSNDKINAPIHNSLFDIDEDAINIGVKMQVLNVYNTYKNKELFL